LDPNRKPKVLITDDEEMVITSVRAYLQLETEFEILGFTEPEQALKFLESTAVEIVVTDFLMPRINGLQLLARAKQLQPETTRVLLTGHADKQSAIQAINDVGLYQYVEKPWDNTQLLLVIQNGVERTQLLRDLKNKVSELDSAHSSLKDVQARLLKAFL
jgi:DNA-binding NtrC family response regulator